MKQTKHDALKEAASPLIKYLCEHHHPMTTAIVTPTGVEVLEGCEFIEINDFVLD